MRKSVIRSKGKAEAILERDCRSTASMPERAVRPGDALFVKDNAAPPSSCALISCFEPSRQRSRKACRRQARQWQRAKRSPAACALHSRPIPQTKKSRRGATTQKWTHITPRITPLQVALHGSSTEMRPKRDLTGDRPYSGSQCDI